MKDMYTGRVSQLLYPQYLFFTFLLTEVINGGI